MDKYNFEQWRSGFTKNNIKPSCEELNKWVDDFAIYCADLIGEYLLEKDGKTN